MHFLHQFWNKMLQTKLKELLVFLKIYPSCFSGIAFTHVGNTQTQGVTCKIHIAKPQAEPSEQALPSQRAHVHSTYRVC